ncbi:MAG: hypothetical protein WKF79_02035 [Nocardioides sp.]
MTKARRRTVISRLLPVVGLAVALAPTTACSKEAGPGASPRGPATTTSQAEAILQVVGVPSDRDFAGGSFEFADPFVGGSSAEDGRLASSSWDVYFVRDTGDVGAWGAGLDIFDSVEAAQRSAQKVATFSVCEGPRQPVDGIDGSDYDVLEAISCPRVADDGYVAYVSASDGVVTANLTVSGPTRTSATTAVVEVWASLSETAQGAVERLPRSAPGAG